ncbi:MAG: hypothetical protein IKW74_05825 [Thermoguttaceae bacterium]|nr:hypothetical protein [Thermoguttaceae bacterium]
MIHGNTKITAVTGAAGSLVDAKGAAEVEFYILFDDDCLHAYYDADDE